ncbi:MAG: ABC transporter permease [Rikenellaceae bacterium]
MKQIFNNFIATLRRYKVSSILNILGLGVAFASFYLIMVQVLYDFNFNKNIEDSERIYRFEFQDENGEYTENMIMPICEGIFSDQPQIENFASIADHGTGTYKYFKNGEEITVRLDSGIVTDGAISLLGLNIIEGSASDFYENHSAIIISQREAEKRGLKVGDQVKIDNKECTIVAIFETLPKGNDFTHYDSYYHIGKSFYSDFNEASFPYFVQLQKGVTPDDIDLSDAIYELIKSVQPDATNEEIEEALNSQFKYRLLPITESYFAENCKNTRFESGNKAVSISLLIIAIMILVLAFVNYINFFFALAPLRVRAVNARKIFGCSRIKLIFNFLTESFGLVVISLFVAVLISATVNDSTLSSCFSTSIALTDNITMSCLIGIGGIILALFTALYPAIYITSFPAGFVIKRGFGSSKTGIALRNTLLGLQFMVTFIFICSAVFIWSQYRFMMNYDMGFNKDNVYGVVLPPSISGNLKTRDSFSEELKANPMIEDVAYTTGDLISDFRMTWGTHALSGKQIETLPITVVSSEFLKFMDIDIVEGRDFNLSDERSGAGVFIINEKAAKVYDLSLEEKISGFDDSYYDVIGICKDFNFQPIDSPIEPFAFLIFESDYPYYPNVLFFRTTPDADVKEVIDNVKKSISAYAPDYNVSETNIQGFDSMLSYVYGDDEQLAILLICFTLVSIIISLMGAFGLVLFETQFRQQEIVIRRVHGATVQEILLMINRKFLIIIGLCFVVAAPVSYLVVSRWLSTFAYHIPISAWVFIAVIAIVTLITTLIVTVQSLKAANSNPAELIGKNA